MSVKLGTPFTNIVQRVLGANPASKLSLKAQELVNYSTVWIIILLVNLSVFLVALFLMPEYLRRIRAWAKIGCDLLLSGEDGKNLIRAGLGGLNLGLSWAGQG